MHNVWFNTTKLNNKGINTLKRISNVYRCQFLVILQLRMEKTIMMQFLRGQKPKYLRSTLYWPNPDFPRKSAWTRWFKRLKHIFTVGNNGELSVSNQLREWTIPIKERQMIHRWWYSEINDDLYEMKKRSITRYFTNEGKYQTYSSNVISKEKCNSLPENKIPITKRDRTTFKIDKQFSYWNKIMHTSNFRKYVQSLPK